MTLDVKNIGPETTRLRAFGFALVLGATRGTSRGGDDTSPIEGAHWRKTVLLALLSWTSLVELSTIW